MRFGALIDVAPLGDDLSASCLRYVYVRCTPQTCHENAGSVLNLLSVCGGISLRNLHVSAVSLSGASRQCFLVGGYLLCHFDVLG
mmetsp:Transcript_93085/g.249205  ORF Transcript_93085/g.249205 Transcript_93085/m.249205 type:complete len:85 (+) Transcript_93085:1110-1364(+)